MTENTVPRRMIVGPFNRVEGDLEITLEVVDGAVRAAQVTAPLFRGFERLLQGRPALDAVVIAPRVCGICSLSQSAAAARALASLHPGHDIPQNGRLTIHLLLATENAADHLTHFTAFFMPDFARPAYQGRWWYEPACHHFRAQAGEAARHLLPLRARVLHAVGLLAGKWPHSLAIMPGGVTKAADSGERLRLLGILAEFRAGLEHHMFASPLEQVAGLSSLADLEEWTDAAEPGSGLARLFLHIARDLGLDRLGPGPGLFLSHGAFDLWSGGLYDGNGTRALDPQAVREDLSHTWLRGGSLHPSHGQTIPDADKAEAYSWAKAPRWNDQVIETGALARQAVAGDPLARDLIATHGSTVRNRVVMRLVELARLVIAMEGWARELVPDAPFCAPPFTLPDGDGIGLVEAARGALGHWVSLEKGLIRRYQIIAPTTWNFSPRDGKDRPGAVESALIGTPVPDGERVPLAVQHVVRSFDPCLACTVH